MVFIDIAVLIVCILSLGFVRAGMKCWLPTSTIVLLLLSYFQTLHWSVLIVAWALLMITVVVFGIPWLRVTLLSRPFYKRFQKLLPPMSRTEKEALDAGDVWWDGDLFAGRPHWQTWLDKPKPSLNTEEQAFIDNQVETLCAMLDDWQISFKDKDLSQTVWDYLKKERFFGLAIPKAFGGMGFSAQAQSAVIVKIASRSVSTAVNAMVPNSLGPGELLVHYGTDEQKQRWLPGLAKGDEIPCFALTSEEVGSDAGGLVDYGVVCKGEYNGEEVLGMRLTWNKRYITLAPVATVLGLAVKLSDPDKLLGGESNLGITLCLIPTSHPGVEVGKRHYPMSLAFMNGTTRGKDVFVPLDWIIGGQQNAGNGWRMLMDCLSTGRAVSLPALSTANGQLCYRMTGAYARLRKQFRLAIGQFEGVQEAMADIAGFTYMMNATRGLSCSAVDQGNKPSVVSAIAKYHMTEMSRKIMERAMDIHAGRGIQMGPRNYLAGGYLGIPVGITVEGANILTRNLMIFGQGAVRCHPFILQEMEAVQAEDSRKGLKSFDKLLYSHIGFAVSNFIRCLTMGLFGVSMVQRPVSGPTAHYFRHLTRMSSALAFLADVSMLILGGDLKRKESLSARFGDVLSYLYLSSTVLKHYHDNGENADELPLVHWCLQTNLYKMQDAIYQVCRNFKPRWLGAVLRFIVFPLGRSYRLPSDKTSHTIAKAMMQPGELRDRMTDMMYVNRGLDDPIGRMENALLLNVEAATIERKLQLAMKSGRLQKESDMEKLIAAGLQAEIIDSAEAGTLQTAELARLDSLKVDEFDFDVFKRS